MQRGFKLVVRHVPSTVLLLTYGVALVADLWTKHRAHRYLPQPDGNSLSELLVAFGQPHSTYLAIELTHVTNGGLILGVLEDGPRWIAALAFHGLTAATLLAGAAVLWKLGTSNRWRAAACTLILVGVVGNLLDRLRFGYVTDWISVHWTIGAWRVEAPAFNFADLYILGGLLAVVALAITQWGLSTLSSRLAHTKYTSTM